jgi:hypothetical protein
MFLRAAIPGGIEFRLPGGFGFRVTRPSCADEDNTKEAGR